MEIVSQTIETAEEAFSGLFCKCNHLKSEHHVGLGGKIKNCSALDFNGSVWSGCRCLEFVEFEFRLKIKIAA